MYNKDGRNFFLSFFLEDGKILPPVMYLFLIKFYFQAELPNCKSALDKNVCKMTKCKCNYVLYNSSFEGNLICGNVIHCK